MNRTRGYITAVLIFILLLLLAQPVFAVAPSGNYGKKVIMGYYSEPGLMNGAEPAAEKSGYAYEYIMELANHSGWKYEYVYGSFRELYQKLLEGKIDMLPYITKTQQRSREILFPDKAMGDEQFYIASMVPGKLDDSLSWMMDKKVGTNKGAFHLEPFNELIKRKGIKCRLVESTDPETRWIQLAKGELDFSIETSTVFQTVPLHAVYEFGDRYPYYLVVAPQRRDLLAELNAAQKLLDDTNPSLLDNLKKKYFRGIPLFKELPEESRRWLSNHPIIRIGAYTNDTPYIFKGSNGKYRGVLPDYMKLMLDAMEIRVPVQWRLFPGKQEALHALHAREIDLINPFFHSYSEAEKSGVIISDTVYASGFSVLYQDDYTEKTMEVIATPETRLGAGYVKANYPEARIVPCKDGYDCIDKLLEGKANSVVMHTDALTEIARSYGKDFKIKQLNATCNVCFVALPENAPLVSIINKAIPFVTDLDMNAIQNKYNAEEATKVKARDFFKGNPEFIYIMIAVFLGIALIVLLGKRRTERAYMVKLEQERKRAEAANAAKTDFLFNMSHDIRTPMNAILGFTDIALKHLDDKKRVQDSLDKTRQAGELLLSLINNILDMSRIEADRAKLNEAPADMMCTFSHLDTIMGEMAELKDIAISFTVENITDRYVLVDYDRCNRILVNIITNAIKYTQQGGFIKVRCEQVGPAENGFARYRYTFEDNGIGMSEEFQQHVFEEFAREENSTTSGIQGTGLGLAVCKSFVNLMKGTIECHSQKGKGTTFVVTLPFRLQTAEQNVEFLARQGIVIDLRKGLGLPENNAFKDRRALVVEDNELNMEIAMNILQEEGLLVESAEDGSIAVRLLQEKGPTYYDFILMDIQMPIMGGYEATRKIRSMYPDTHIPIIAVSANAFDEDRVASREAGMDDHVAKPIDVGVLMTTLARFL